MQRMRRWLRPELVVRIYSGADLLSEKASLRVDLTRQQFWSVLLKARNVTELC